MANKRLSVIIDADISGFQRSVKGMQDSMNGATGGVSKTLGKLGGAVKNTVSTIGKIAGTVGVFKLVDGAINMVTASFDSAISRVDTLNQFPKVLELMGYGAESAEKATARLAEGIQGLPTRLDEVSGTTQRMVNIFQDVDKATESTLAMNNAFLASGSSQADASRGLEQYIQMLGKGEVDMQSWRTLQETMPYALQQTAEAFGFTGRSAQNDFYGALKDGDITMDQFNDKVIELSNAQGGFAEVALESTKGIRTSWTNIKTAVTNGVAKSITAFNDWLKSAGFGEIHDILDGIKNRVGDLFTAVADSIPKILDFFVDLYNTVKDSTAWQTLSDAVQSLIDIGKQLLTNFFESSTWENIKQTLKDLAQAVLDIDFGEVITQTGEFLDKWSPLIIGIVGAIGAFKVLSTLIPIVVGVFGALKTAFGFIALITSFKDAIMLLGMVFPILTSPILWVAVAIGALIAIGVLLYKNWETIKAKASEIWGAIKETFSSIHESIQTTVQNAWNKMTEFFTKAHESIKETVQNAWNGIVDFFKGLHERIQTTVQEAWNAVADFLSNMWNSITEIAKAIWEPIKDFFTSLWEGVKSIFSTIWTGIKNVLILVMGLILVALATAWNGIADVINSVLNVIRTVVTTIWNAIKGHVEVAVNAIKSVIITVWDLIKIAVTTAVNAIRTAVITVWNAIRDVVTTIVNAIKTVVTTVFNAIKTTITNVINEIKSVITVIWNTIKSITTTVFNAVKSVVITVWNAIRTAITNAINTIRTTISNIWNSILTTLTTIMTNIRTTMSNVWNGIRTTVTNIATSVKNSVTNAFNSLKSTVSRIWNNIKTAIETPIKKARDTVRTMIDNIKGFFNFQWKLPKLKMPRFSVSGSANPINWLKEGVPKINVDWFATGGIATGASVVGIGEKGSEAIVPLSQKHRMKPFAQAVASMMPKDDSDGNGKGGDTYITGNTFVVREEADIKKVSKELYKLQQKEKFSKGL